MALLTDYLTTLAPKCYPRPSHQHHRWSSTKRHIENSENITPTRRSDVSHFHFKELESPKKHRNEHYMFQVLKQVSQLKQSQPQEFKIPRSKAQKFFSRLSNNILSTKIQDKGGIDPFLLADPTTTTTILVSTKWTATITTTSLWIKNRAKRRGSSHSHPWSPNIDHFLQGSTRPYSQKIGPGSLGCQRGQDRLLHHLMASASTLYTQTVQSGLPHQNKNAFLRSGVSNPLEKRGNRNARGLVISGFLFKTIRGPQTPNGDQL